MTIHKQLKQAGVTLGHWETDIHALVTPESTKIIQGYEWRVNVTEFISEIDGKRWYDIPFAYEKEVI